MLTVTTPRNYRAQCQVLAALKSRIRVPFTSPDDPTQINPAWAAAANAILVYNNASEASIRDLENWIEDENEAGKLLGTEPSIPVPVTEHVRKYRHAVDEYGNVDSVPTAAGAYAVSGGALLIRGRRSR